MTVVSGTVYIDGVSVGTVSGEILDEQSNPFELIKTRSIDGIVYVDTTPIGNVRGIIDDTVAKPGDGSVSITITGSVLVDSVSVGSVSGSHTDNAGDAPSSTGLYKFDAEVIATPGGSFTLNVTVRNLRNVDVTLIVDLYDHNNNLVQGQSVLVPAGGTATVTFNPTAPSTPGNYNWRVVVHE